MSLSATFLERPVASSLLAAAVALAGIVAVMQLPVAALPNVDFPTILVQASLPGASPETMASSVARPLERRLGQIADVTEMTSISWLGTTRVTLQFGLDRNIDAAARDVQSALNAAAADLPPSLKSNPIFHKVNPADTPLMLLSLSSTLRDQGQLYDWAVTVLEQKLSQVEGVGQVVLGGSSLPAVRVEINPGTAFKYGIGLEDIRAALAAANTNSPKGAVELQGRRLQIYTNDQAWSADQYRSLIIANRGGVPVRLSDVARVEDSVEDLRNRGVANGESSVLVLVYGEPGANMIETADRIERLLPRFRSAIPAGIDLEIVTDRTTTVRASLREIEWTLVFTVALVMLVVYLFLQSARAALVPAVAIAVSLLGTCGIMVLLGFSLDNLSLMALIVATGFVVDDAVVVLESIARRINIGMAPSQAVMQGVREVGFTVIAVSLSLVSAFIPILFMGGLVGRLFREFAVTLSVAIGLSLLVSLTTTPVLCARVYRDRPRRMAGAGARTDNPVLQRLLRGYDRTLRWALDHTRLVLLTFATTVMGSIWMLVVVPKGFFPPADTGNLVGRIQADQSASFELVRDKLTQFISIIRADPAVAGVAGFAGGRQSNSGTVYVALKPLGQRDLSADQVIARLRRELGRVPGAKIYLQSAQDIQIGGRQSNAQYQYTLEADDLAQLKRWAPRMTEALQSIPGLLDVNSDQQDKGLGIEVAIDRDRAAALGISAGQIDNTLYDAFGQRQVSTIYQPLNQYNVVMEVAPEYWHKPETLDAMFVSTSGFAPSGVQSTNAPSGTVSANAAAGTARLTSATLNDPARNASLNELATHGRGRASAGAAISTAAETMVPLAAFAHFDYGKGSLSVHHQGLLPAVTISFNLSPDTTLNEAMRAIEKTRTRIGLPQAVHGTFSGVAQTFRDSLAAEPVLIVAAVLAVYIVLGILYESYVHPLTILSTLPSAAAGAVLSLMAARAEFSVIALIGLILLIGIVQKNAIMMVDVAIDASRRFRLKPRDAIHRACLVRVRPILMTTLTALCGAIPLAAAFGDGAELRRPLGIVIIGGLVVSQLLTLYTTPVIYVCLDRFRNRGPNAGKPSSGSPAPMTRRSVKVAPAL